MTGRYEYRFWTSWTEQPKKHLPPYHFSKCHTFADKRDAIERRDWYEGHVSAWIKPGAEFVEVSEVQDKWIA